MDTEKISNTPIEEEVQQATLKNPTHEDRMFSLTQEIIQRMNSMEQEMIKLRGEYNLSFTKLYNGLENMSDKLNAQSRQIAKMNEAFDMIMGDYFEEVTDGVEDFSSFLRQFVVDNGKEHLLAKNTEGERKRESLLTRLELLKGRTELVEETTVSFSSENMQEIYRAIIPGIKSEIDALYNKISNDLVEMHKANTNNLLGNTDAILGSIKSHNDNLNNQTRNLISRISSSEKATKMAMPGNGRSNYRD